MARSTAADAHSHLPANGHVMEHMILLLAAAAVVGMSKGGLASAGSIAVPMLALFMDPIKAAALLLPVYIVTDWVAVWLYRRDFSTRNLLILIPAMLLGTAIATILTPYTPESVLLFLTGLIGLWYCLRAWLGRGIAEKSKAGVIPGVCWGAVTGIASFITHSGGPPAQAYLLPQRLPKLEFAGTLAIAFMAVNLSKIPAYWQLGKLHSLNWQTTLALVATGIVFTRVGRALTLVLSETSYRRLIEGLLFLLSVILIGKAGWLVLATVT